MLHGRLSLLNLPNSLSLPSSLLNSLNSLLKNPQQVARGWPFTPDNGHPRQIKN